MSSAEFSEWEAVFRIEHREREKQSLHDDMAAKASAGVEARKARMRRG